MLLAVRISSYGCTWEVWRALKKLELLSAAPRATLTLLSCSPNFPRASITRNTHAKHEPILNSNTTLPGGGGGGYCIYSLVGRCGRAPHTLTLFKTNMADFPTLFKTEFRFLIPCLRHLTRILINKSL